MQKKKELFIAVCPKCRSSKTIFFINDGSLINGRRCEDCYYVGIFPEMTVENAKKFKNMKDE